jgi:hypothetical protein
MADEEENPLIAKKAAKKSTNKKVVKKYANSNRTEYVKLKDDFSSALENVNKYIDKPINEDQFKIYLDELTEQVRLIGKYITEKSDPKFTDFKDKLQTKLLDINIDNLVQKRKEYVNSLIKTELTSFQTNMESYKDVKSIISINKQINIYNKKFEGLITRIKELDSRFNNSEIIKFYTNTINTIRKKFNKNKIDKTSIENEKTKSLKTRYDEINSILDSIDTFVSSYTIINIKELKNLSSKGINNLLIIRNEEKPLFKALAVNIKSINEKIDYLDQYFNGLKTREKSQFQTKFDEKIGKLDTKRSEYTELYETLKNNIVDLYNNIFEKISEKLNNILKTFKLSNKKTSNKIGLINKLIIELSELNKYSTIIEKSWEFSNVKNYSNNLNIKQISNSFIPFIIKKINSLKTNIKNNINKQVKNQNNIFIKHKEIFKACLTNFISQIDIYSSFQKNIQKTISSITNQNLLKNVQYNYENKVTNIKTKLENINKNLNAKFEVIKKEAETLQLAASQIAI